MVNPKGYGSGPIRKVDRGKPWVMAILFGILCLGSGFMYYSVWHVPSRIRKLGVLVGDSITQQGYGFYGDGSEALQGRGWVSMLSEKYTRKVDFLNRGYSGFNSRWVDERLGQILSIDSRKIDLAVVFLGANDASYKGQPAAVPASAYMRYLTNIVTRLQRQWGAHVVLVGPPPIAETALKVRNAKSSHPRGLDRDNARARSFSKAAESVAKALHVPFVDAWEGLDGHGTEEERTKLLRDGLHLSDEGNKRLFSLVASTIEREVPGWAVDALVPDLPAWSDLSTQDADAMSEPE